jgi:RNA polymerase sigma-70 factor (ECF subfamily)
VAQLVWSQGGQPRVVFTFTIEDGTVTTIDLLADPARLGAFEVSAVEG